LLLVVLLAGAARPLRGAEEYEIGGPLAGVKLPLWPTQHGEPPGHPGSIPNSEFQGHRPGPEWQLYPGSVEHWSEYWMKYIPSRSLFDRQSMLKNWVAPNIPGADSAAVEPYASPVYRIPDNGTPLSTGRKDQPVAVIRCQAGAPVFKLDLGELEAGVYVVRIIGAVPTAQLRQFRLPLFVAMNVNDGPKGEVSSYRQRCNYVDEFYSVCEIYFHALEKRRYQAELWLDQGTQVDLLVHNITLDDVLAGIERRAIKKRQMLLDPESQQAIKAELGEKASLLKNLKAFEFDPAERLARDEMIWRFFPPVNAQGHINYRFRGAGRRTQGVTMGAGGMTQAEIETKYGKWEPVAVTKRGLLGLFASFPPKVGDPRGFLVNEKLNLKYTVDDLAARRPLPDPFPFKDSGAGLYEPDPNDPDKGSMYCPIAEGVDPRWRESVLLIDGAARVWVATRNRGVAHDGAMALVRYAFSLPTIDASQYLALMAACKTPHANDSVRFRYMCDLHLHHYEHFHMAICAYDYLFDYIQGNEELARSVRRFVPWVKSPEDVIKLLDTYLVQFTAKKCMRYHYNRGSRLPSVIAVLGDPKFTEPWSEFLFARIFQYPLSPAGVQDLLISGFDRGGCNYIGSAFYAQRGGCRTNLEELAPYLNTVAGTKFDLRNPVLYPKPLAHCRWRLAAQVGGLDLLRIGDVRGPDKAPGGTSEMEKLGEAARSGWQWSGDPQFAWLLANLAGRQGESDDQWSKIEAAAKQVRRAPWLDNRSRFIANWAGILETGLEYDDYRFRRAVYVRTGVGKGHEHADTLDLQLLAHGLPMTVDDGQRSGYCKPNSRFSCIHNTVEVDGGGNGEYGLMSYGWVSALSDAPGARYLKAEAVPPPGAALYQRQTALIDLDEGRGSQPLSASQQRPGAALPKDVRTANSYVFDVFRVSGGKLHTYCFHAMVDDQFQWNAQNVKPVEHVLPGGAKKAKAQKKEKPADGQAAAAAGEEKGSAEDRGEPGRGEESAEQAAASARKLRASGSEGQYLAPFSESAGHKFAGDAPDVLQATWRYSRDEKNGSEQKMLGPNFDSQGPRKFTRLHLFDTAGMRALQAQGVCLQPNIPYRYTCLVAQRRGKRLEAAFPALIEPYAGEPIITGRRLLPVVGNEDDALRAVAVEVKTAVGQTDLCFADGRPEKVRAAGEFRIAGEFAYCSADAAGLRACALTGGTLLEGPQVQLLPALRQRTARMHSVDYAAKTFRIDAPWPPACSGRLMEIGTPGHWTAYTADRVMPEGSGAVVTTRETADFYRAAIVHVDSRESRIDCSLEIAVAQPGYRQNIVASDDRATRFWRVEQTKAKSFTVKQGRVSADDFGPERVLRLWEYGGGDTVRQATSVGLRRTAPGVFQLHADVDVTLALRGRAIDCSTDTKDWQPLPAIKRGGWVEARIGTDMFEGSALWIRVK
jgi:hypothetical protein